VAKRVKGFINQTLIYPPGDLEQAMGLADPLPEDSERLFGRILEAVTVAA
jgi:hypothetical protein